MVPVKSEKDEKNGQYEEYEGLLLDRDACKKAAGVAATAYVKEFGSLINESFKVKVDCIAKKKGIEYYQMAKNRGEEVKVEELNKYLEETMKEYDKQLKEMVKEYEECKKAGVSSLKTVEEVKKLYHKIAKMIHPDLNPRLAEKEGFTELWERVVESYHMNDLEALKEEEVLVNKWLSENGVKAQKIEVEGIEERIEKLKKEIEKIKTTEPYLYREMLESEEKVRQKKEELEKEIKEYEEYNKELEEVLKEYLKGGIILTWQGN